MNYIKIICGSAAVLLSACGGDGKGLSHASSASSVASATVSSPHSSSSSQSIVLPTSLGDKLVSQTIEHITSTLPSGTHRESGDLQVYYGGNSTLVGDSLLLNRDAVAGSYSAVYDAAQQKIQVTSQLLEPTGVKIVDTYSFVTATEGLWQQDYNSGSLLLEGRFALQSKDYPGFAPQSFAGRKASLTFTKTVTSLPPGTYIDSGTAFHIYTSATAFATDLSNYGLPAGEGNYSYDRPALNIGRDTGFNITFNAPYQIEYEFSTLSSGIFRENWNSGQILWEGTFVINDID